MTYRVHFTRVALVEKTLYGWSNCACVLVKFCSSLVAIIDIWDYLRGITHKRRVALIVKYVM